MTDPVLRLDRIEKRFPAARAGQPPVHALAGVCLAVAPGEFVALLGPSGCGKTTLLRCVAGFVEPQAGDIFIDGVRVNDLPPYKRPLNTVFQSYALFPHMTVAQNIGYGPARQGVARAEVGRRVEQALEMTGLQGFGERYPASLSGGQQQRVALARAVINRPRLLLLDEPLSALDLKLRRRMQVELKRLQERLGITFVFVTHDQEEAMAMADRIVVMDRGAIVQQGSGEEIYRAPVNRFVADFIGEANLLDCRVDEQRRLRLGDALLPYQAPAAAARATLLVRPEAVRVGEPVEGAVRLSGKLRDMVFRGDSIRLHIELPDGVEVIAQLAPPLAAGVVPGATLPFGWAESAGRVLVD